jgi:hypothetical protein
VIIAAMKESLRSLRSNISPKMMCGLCMIQAIISLQGRLVAHITKQSYLFR